MIQSGLSFALARLGERGDPACRLRGRQGEDVSKRDKKPFEDGERTSTERWL